MNEAESRKRRFVELTGTTDHWARARELVELLDAGDYWDHALLGRAVDEFKLAHVRRMVKTVRDESGWPVIASIELLQPDGSRERVYMPEALFVLDEYRQVIGYWQDRAHYAIEMSNGYSRRAESRFGVQLPLPFPETD